MIYTRILLKWIMYFHEMFRQCSEMTYVILQILLILNQKCQRTSKSQTAMVDNISDLKYLESF